MPNTIWLHCIKMVKIGAILRCNRSFSLISEILHVLCGSLEKSFDTDILLRVRELLTSVSFVHHMNLCVAVLSGQWKLLLMKM